MGGRSETVVQTCAERGEVAFCVVDVLEGGLQSDVAVQLATVCQLNGVLGALTEASALSRQSALVEAVAVGAAHLGIPVADTLATGVLRVLRHARHAAVGSRPHGLLGIRPPGAGGLVCSSVGRRHFAIRADGILPRVDSHAGEVVRTAVRILQLRDVEHAVLRRSHEERIVSTFPSVVASAVVQAVSECPTAPRHVEVDRKPRERIVGYGVVCGDGGEDATGAVDEERGDVFAMCSVEASMVPLPSKTGTFRFKRSRFSQLVLRFMSHCHSAVYSPLKVCAEQRLGRRQLSMIKRCFISDVYVCC